MCDILLLIIYAVFLSDHLIWSWSSLISFTNDIILCLVVDFICFYDFIAVYFHFSLVCLLVAASLITDSFFEVFCLFFSTSGYEFIYLILYNILLYF